MAYPSAGAGGHLPHLDPLLIAPTGQQSCHRDSTRCHRRGCRRGRGPARSAEPLLWSRPTAGRHCPIHYWPATSHRDSMPPQTRGSDGRGAVWVVSGPPHPRWSPAYSSQHWRAGCHRDSTPHHRARPRSPEIWTHCPLSMSHTRKVPSSLPLSRLRLSGVKARSYTPAVCPCSPVR